MAKTSNFCFLNFLQLSEMFDKRSCNFQLLQLLPLCPNGKILQWKKLPTWKHASKIRKISQKNFAPKLNSPKFHGFIRIVTQTAKLLDTLTNVHNSIFLSFFNKMVLIRNTLGWTQFVTRYWMLWCKIQIVTASL